MSHPDAADICRRVLDNSSEAVFRARDGVIEWISPPIADVIGLTADEMIGRTTVHLWHPDEHDAAIELRERAARGEAAESCLRLRHANGGFVWVDVRVGPADDARPERTVVGSIRLADPHGQREQRRDDAERLCQLVAANAQDVIWTLDTAGVVLSVTPSVETVLGWQPADVVGTFLPALVHPDDRPRVAPYRHAVHSGQQPGRLEIRVQARGGAWKWASVSGSRSDGRGRGPIVVVSWRDIDELVREREIAEHEAERLRAVLDSSLDPRVTLVAVRDQAGQIIDFRYEDANARACEAMGMTRDRMIGARLLDVFPGVREAGFLDGYVRAVETGVPFEVNDVPYANEIAGATLRYDIRAHAVGDALMFTWRDVTARSVAADETAEAAAHFAKMARHAGDTVLRVENDTITWASGSGNPLLQFQAGQVLDGALQHMLDADDHRAIDQLHASLAAGVPYVAVWPLVDAAGRDHAMVVRAQAIGTGVDARTDIIVTMTDITNAPVGDEADGELADLINRYLDR